MLGFKCQLHGEGLVVGVAEPQPPVAPLAAGADGQVVVDQESAELARLNLYT